MKHVAIEKVRNRISVRAIMELGSYTMLFPPRRLTKRIIIEVVAEPIAVARPREKRMNLNLSVIWLFPG